MKTNSVQTQQNVTITRKNGKNSSKTLDKIALQKAMQKNANASNDTNSQPSQSLQEFLKTNSNKFNVGASDSDIKSILESTIIEFDEEKNTPSALLGSTIERIEAEKKEKLNEDELASYEQYEDVLANLEEGKNKEEAIFNMLEDMEPEQIASLLTAVDFMKQEEGGAGELLFTLFKHFISGPSRHSDVVEKLGEILSDEDINNIVSAYATDKIIVDPEEKDKLNENGVNAFLSFLYGDVTSCRQYASDGIHPLIAM